MKNILYDTFFKRIFVSDVGIKYMSLIISELYNLDNNDLINNITVINNENTERMIEMFKMVYENGKIFPVFNEEQFHENEKREMFEQGIERGEEKKQFDIAKILKKKNFSNKDIVDITNLTEEQVMKL